MNKGKIFVISLVSVICISAFAVIILSTYLISQVNWNISSINIPVSFVLGTNTDQQTDPDFMYVTVVDIVDGDTVKVLENGEKVTIRLIGIDAPEVHPKECKNDEATNRLSELILNKEVVIQSDSTQSDLDKYGRQLRYIFLDGLNVNQEMIKEGLAREYTYNKPYIYQSEFIYAEQGAKDFNLGIWSEECSVY